MTQLWQPGTQYNIGDEVEYDGARYRIIQPHFSQGDWTPPVTPALWGRMQGGGSGHGHGHGHAQPSKPECHDPPQQHQQPSYGQQPIAQQPPKYGSGNGSDSESDGEGGRRKKNWYDIDSADKKKLGLAGGLLAGAAALGAGVIAYKKHEEHKDEAASQAWAANNWLEEARARAAQFNQFGPKGPYTWYLTQGKNIPQGALLVGTEHSWNLYVCRALYDGALVLGKASDAFKKGGVLGTQNKEVHVDTYEILLGDSNRLRWVPYSGKFSLASLGAQPIEGGREANGTRIYVVQAFHKGAVHPGKVGDGWDSAYIPYDGREKAVTEYKVLCLA
ncbi:hypothetical protein CVT24_006668 [Panaeolus cyanescens]|uniref:Chitin-binding type-3 domain-containing protein n=1 Tax=Panaeolus cyanescens TaxID=181874 RepID=A0A409YSH4_9AGAR|nr:hypothetical protein CVT24_006668 [Panaeolus cyanescens]